jgi:FG-GAP-like repeat
MTGDAGYDAGFDAGAGCSGAARPIVPIFGSEVLANSNPAWIYGVTTGDVNGDGLPDLLSSTQNGVGVYLGLADGGLGVHVEIGGSGSIFATTFDVDGGAPIAAIEADGRVYVYSLSGQQLGAYSPSSFAQQLAVLDLNGDGVPDIATCENDRVEGFLNLGGGTLGVPFPLGPTCRLIATGDLNLDGLPDLVTAISTTAAASVTVQLAQQDGGFTSTMYPITPGGMGWFTALHDINGDGLLDIVVASDPGFVILMSQGGGAFAEPVSYTIPGGSQGYLAIDDFNGDCWPDIFATGDYGGCAQAGIGFRLFLNHGDGLFGSPLLFDAGFQFPFGISAYRGPNSALPSIAVGDVCSGEFELLPNLTQP